MEYTKIILDIIELTTVIIFSFSTSPANPGKGYW